MDTRYQRKGPVRALIALALATLATSVSAATIHVPADYATIQEAIDAAMSGDTVLVAPGIYTGDGNRDIELRGKAVSVIGDGGPEAVFLDCLGLRRGFHIHEGETTATLIQGFTIRNGRCGVVGIGAGAGVRVDGASPTLRDLHIEDCESISWGGGLHLCDGAPVVEDVVITGCAADDHGGGLSACQVTTDLTGLVIHGNSASDLGGGIYIEDCRVHLEHVTVAGNECALFGGGIAIWEGGSVAIVNSIIAHATAAGGIHQYGAAAVTVTCCDVYGNTGGDYGGSLPDQTGVNGNISADPLFCDMAGGDLGLGEGSPCLPENNDCGVLMGALGQGCAVYPHLITGTVRALASQPMAGVHIMGGPAYAETGPDGVYTVDVPEGWSGTLTPVRPNTVFTPPSRTYTDVAGDYLDQDYVGDHESLQEVPAEFLTIQAALDYAIDGDTVLVAPGTYTGPGNRDLQFDGKVVLLISEAGAEQTILDGGGGEFWAFVFPGSGEQPSTIVDGFSIVDFGDQELGALFFAGPASPTLRNLVIRDNDHLGSWSDSRNPGGMRCTEGASPQLENCVFQNNAAPYGGAVLCESGAVPRFEDVTFIGNFAILGGAVESWQASPQFVDCRFLQNRAEPRWVPDGILFGGRGGAVFLQEDCQPVFEGCLFAGNVAERDPYDYYDPIANPGYGGALAVTAVTGYSPVWDMRAGGETRQGSTPTLISCTFHGNIAEDCVGLVGRGGGIYCDDESEATIDRVIITGSTGGGFFTQCEASAVVISCSDVWNNLPGNYLGMIPDQTGINGNISADPLFCDPVAGDFTIATGSPCLPENNDCGLLMGAYGHGCEHPTGVTEEAAPAVLRLAANYPNPFNPETAIRFGLPADAAVDLEIFDVAGRRVAVLLAAETLPAGWHTVTWRGRDDAGRALASGVYLYRLRADGLARVAKMTLLK